MKSYEVQENAAVNEMDNDPETEEVYAANKAPVDTVDGGTVGHQA